MRKFSILLVFICVTIFSLYNFVIADNPSSPFTPSQNIQDPGSGSTPGTGGNGCGPNDSNCYVNVSSELSGLDAATAINTIDSGNYLQEWQWNTLAGGTALKLSSISTLAVGNTQKLFEVNLSGANATTTQKTHAGYFSNTHTGLLSTNVGLYATASGATTNYAIESDGALLLDNIVIQNIGTRSISIGAGTPSVTDSFFFGQNAGASATGASNSNFMGQNAGSGATSASISNFIGLNAGLNATSASFSNFIGWGAGSGATSSTISNFFGVNAGAGATGVSGSNFLGSGAGQNAVNADDSNFLGGGAGNGVTGVYNGNFLGNTAGSGATNAYNSNFFGNNSGYQATAANNSSFFGQDAGNSASAANDSNFFGQQAGNNADNASNSNFFGYSSGYQATNAAYSNFFGANAGLQATNAVDSNFLGQNAGYQATNADHSNFFGENAGGPDDFFNLATNADHSNFFGENAGAGATGSENSNFFGHNAGYKAITATNSNFFGANAGNNADNAANSIFIGASAGNNDIVDNTGGGYSILLGPSTSTGGFSNSIAMGRGATNTASNQLIFGSSTTDSYIDSIFFGSGVTATSPVNYTLNGSGASGVDITGGDITLAGGKGTGDALGGALIFQTSDPGASGATLQSLTTKATLLGSGNFGIGDTTPASLFTVGNGDLFQVASDGSIDAITGYIQGSGTMSLTSANTTETTTSSIFALNANSLTTGTGMYLASSSLTSGSLLDLAITGTGAIDTQKGINIDLSGANATGSQTSYGIYSRNAHTGTNPHNYGVMGVVANGSTVSAGIYGSNSGSGYGTAGVSTSGTGVHAVSTSGTGLHAQTTSGGHAATFSTNPTSTNTAANLLGLSRYTSGTAAAGIGGAFIFNVETADGGANVAWETNTLVSSWGDPTFATRTSELYFTGINSGTSGTLMTLEGNGEVGIGTSDPSTLLHLSTSTANTGTAQNVLTINAYSTGTPALGFGPSLLFTGESNGGPNDRDMVALQSVWEQSSVDASRTSALAFLNVNSAGALTERFRFTPSAMTTSTSYTLGNSNSTITLGNSTYQVSVTSSSVNVGAGAIFSPANTSDMTFGKSISGSSGSATYTALSITNGFNMTGTQSGIMRGININPTLTSLTAATYRAIDIQANHASAYGIYQSGTSTQNYFAGEVGISNSSPAVALHVGSSATTDATTLLRLEDANSTCNFTADAGAPTCGSDQNLKKDIEELNTNSILENIVSLNPVSYRWKTDDNNSPLQYGFLAQNVQEYFPHLVKEGTWIDGTQKLFLSMGGLMPYTVGAIKELNLKLKDIETILANFSQELHTEKLCIGSTCIDEDQLKALMQNGGVNTENNNNEEENIDLSEEVEDNTGNTEEVVTENAEENVDVIIEESEGEDISPEIEEIIEEEIQEESPIINQEETQETNEENTSGN